MSKYNIMNNETGDFKTVEAENIHNACTKCGWLPSECYIVDVTDRRKHALSIVRWASSNIGYAIDAGNVPAAEMAWLEGQLEKAISEALRIGCTKDDIMNIQCWPTRR